jgi:hypothetical protein
MSEAGATTIVGGPNGKQRADDFLGGVDSNPNLKAGPAVIERGPVEPFVIASDYMDETRPFFVKIEKNGVLPALAKLDLELQNVGLFACFDR